MFLICSLLIWFAYQTKPAASKGEPNQASKTHNLKNEESQNPQSTCQTIVLQQSCNDMPRQEKSQPQTREASTKSHDWIDRLNAFSTFVIAVFTILLFIGVAVQISTSRDTERAWVIANPTDNAPHIGFIPAGGSNLENHQAGANQRNAFGCAFKSTGNTPARLVELAIRYRKTDRLEDIPRQPDYGLRAVLNDLPLVTGDSVGYVAFLEPDIILKRSEFDAVYQQNAFLYAFGIVVYRDVYNRLHETRFGYVYHFPQGGDPQERGFRKEGLPPGYNRAT
jgi:hypothetical protein